MRSVYLPVSILLLSATSAEQLANLEIQVKEEEDLELFKNPLDFDQLRDLDESDDEGELDLSIYNRRVLTAAQDSKEDSAAGLELGLDDDLSMSMKMNINVNTDIKWKFNFDALSKLGSVLKSKLG